MAENCRECTAAGRNFEAMCSKGDLGSISKSKELLQLDFWGPINYLNESKKYVNAAVDRFSRWPMAMVRGP